MRETAQTVLQIHWSLVSLDESSGETLVVAFDEGGKFELAPALDHYGFEGDVLDFC